MDNGEILQQSDPYTVYYRPANTFVGDFMGASNLAYPVYTHTH